jgi:ABC-type glycerol-3-phosphate transport system permease component
MSLLRGLATIVVRHALMLSIAVAAIYPVYYMIATSLKTRSAWTADQFGLPLNPTLENYGAVFADGRIPAWFLNSVLVTGISVILATVVATFAAYAIARIAFRGATFLLRLMVALMVIPPAVLILPLFLGFQPLGLVNTYQGVILIYAGMLVPISVFMLVSFFRTLPVELFEAARIDGASTFRILGSIVVPLSAPGFVTLVVVNSLWVWNELLIALVFLQDDSRRTLMAGLTLFKGHYSVNEPLVMAGTFIAALPMLLLFLGGQRFFVRGLVAGAVK